MAILSNYTTCNMMTGSGFDTSLLGAFAMAWLATVIIFFAIMFARKYLGEEMGIPFSNVGAFIGGYLIYLGTITFTCSPKWSLLAGLLGAAVGAYFGSYLLGDDGGGGY